MRLLGSRQTLIGCLNGYSPMNSVTAWTITTGGFGPDWRRTPTKGTSDPPTDQARLLRIQTGSVLVSWVKLWR
jgi:hypothetical protein